jgi:hypothetical protein
MRKLCQGLVAVLDALGASSFNDKQIESFVNNRQELLKALEKNATDAMIEGDTGKLARAELDTFTFGDTLIVTYTVKGDLTARALVRFFALIRQFLVDSLVNEILFRGAIGVGTFRQDSETNTVMGEALSDAAAWHQRADWFGAIATPRTTLAIERLLGDEEEQEKKRWAFVSYDVPLKGDTTQRLKCVNWPKIFLVPHLVPGSDASDPRRRFLSCLERQLVPFGTESKYFNSLAFFDRCVALEEQRPVRQGARGNAPPSRARRTKKRPARPRA